MSSRQGSGARGQGSGARGQGPGVRGQGPGVRGQGSRVRREGPGVRGQESGLGRPSWNRVRYAAYRLPPTAYRLRPQTCHPLPTPYCLLPTAYCLLPLIAWLLALLTSLAWANACRAEDAAAQRWQQIENMTPAGKKQLKRQLDRLAAFKSEEQQRIRQLHQEIEDSQDAEQLRRVMHAYCAWLKSLPAYVRAELAELKPPERIQRIQELRAEEARRPKLEDMEGLFRWMKQFAADPEHQAEILKGMPEPGKKSFPKFGEPEDRNWVAARILWEQFRPRSPGWHGWPGFSDKPPWLTEERLAALRACLSDETSKRLAKMSLVEQWEVISGWVERSRGPGFSSRGFRGGPPSQELLGRLSQFFEKLPPEDQDELVNLPADQMQRELQSKYFRSLGLMPGPDGRWEDGGPPGDRARGDGGPPESDSPPGQRRSDPRRGSGDGDPDGPPPAERSKSKR